MSGVLDQLRDGVRRSSTSWFVPGRIEVLGKHTDYAGGRSLLAAVDLGHTITATVREDRVICARSAATADEVRIDLDTEDPGDLEGAAAAYDDGSGHWGGYVRTVVDRLEANFPRQVRGADLSITSTLPLASGMSSSSALIVGLALALIDLSDLAQEPTFLAEVTTDEQLSEYLGCVENGQSFGALTGHRGVGTFGGSEDHTGMLCGRSDALVQYSFCPVRHERTVTLGEELAFAIAVSGVEAVKTGAARDAYNRVSLAVSELAARWREETGRKDRTIADVVAAGPEAVTRLKELAASDEYTRGRLGQFLDESERIIPAAAVALEDGDLDELGILVDESQRGAEEGLGNQVPETIALQRIARGLGAHAASAFGAGFGGSVWALVPADGAADFARRWMEAYHREHPEHAETSIAVTCRPGDHAHRVEC